MENAQNRVGLLRHGRRLFAAHKDGGHKDACEAGQDDDTKHQEELAKPIARYRDTTLPVRLCS